MKVVLAGVLCVSLLATGCSAQWLSVALSDLPVLTQMALNLAAVAATLQSGQQISPEETAAIQNISSEAGRDLSLLQALYNQYKASPSDSTLGTITATIGEIEQNLPALLVAAHISDPALSARVAAAVNLILTTVESFAMLIPQKAQTTTMRRVEAKPIAIAKAADLKQQWNQRVCGPTGKAGIDKAMAVCAVR